MVKNLAVLYSTRVTCRARCKKWRIDNRLNGGRLRCRRSGSARVGFVCYFASPQLTSSCDSARGPPADRCGSVILKNSTGERPALHDLADKALVAKASGRSTRYCRSAHARDLYLLRDDDVRKTGAPRRSSQTSRLRITTAVLFNARSAESLILCLLSLDLPRISHCASAATHLDD